LPETQSILNRGNLLTTGETIATNKLTIQVDAEEPIDQYNLHNFSIKQSFAQRFAQLIVCSAKHDKCIRRTICTLE
jgi:hypothetical protein